MGERQKWEMVATGGDFLTTSTQFILVPGVLVCPRLDEPRTIRYSTSVVVSTAAPCEIGLMVDGNYIATVGAASANPNPSLTTLEIGGIVHLPTGLHVLQLAFRVALPGNHGYPEGPREWSPRKKKIPPALLMMNPRMPATLLAIAVWREN